MAIEYNFTLDMDRSKRDNNIAYARTGDMDSIVINADLVFGGAAYTPSGENAFFECITPNGRSIRSAAEKTGSSVTVEVPPAAFQAAGVINVAYFRFESGETGNPTYVESTEPFAIVVREGIGDALDAGDYIEEWRKLVDHLEVVVADVGQKAEQVEIAKAAAEKAKADAETAGTAAANSASEAKSSATAAQQSATAAAESAKSVADKYITSAQATTLDPGSQATASVENQVLTIGVPKGDKGDQGDKGETGDKGDPGTAATIAVGSVTGLPAGASPTVNNSGTANAAVLDFGIPKGDKGEKGDPGTTTTVVAAEGSDLSVSTDEGTVTIDDSALRARIAELENQAANVVTGTVTGLVSHGEDAFPQKPSEVRIKGKTWVNRFPVVSADEYQGMTLSTDETGLISFNGTSTGFSRGFNLNGLASNKQYTMSCSMTIPSTFNIYIGNDSGILYKSSLQGKSSVTFTTGDVQTDNPMLFVVCASGNTVNASFRVMLVDGTEAPDCFTPPASITSAQPGKLVTAGKNLVDPSRQENGAYTYQDDGTINAVSSDTRLWGYARSNIFMSLPAGSYALSLQTVGADGANNAFVIYDAEGTVLRSVTAPEFNSGDRIIRTLTLSHQSEIGVFWKLIGNGTATIQLELGSTATAYEPPTVTQTPLPEVELRSLPNGTCDELVIKEDGTCEVERKTVQVTFDGSEDEAWARAITEDGTYRFYIEIDGVGVADTGNNKAVSDLLPLVIPGGTNSAGVSNGFTTVEDALYIKMQGVTDVASLRQSLSAKPMTVVATLEASSTEPQSPVTLPALPAPTFNQYHDADVPSDTTVTYERDLNIVIDNLAKQVAGTAATVAINEATR